VSARTNMVFADSQSDLEGVVSRYSPVLFRVALRRLGNIQDAEDAVQDAFLSAHKCIGQFQGRSKLSTWLTRIVTNAALMKLRRHPRYEMLSLGLDGENEGTAFVSKLIDAGPNPEDIYAQMEIREMLRRALAQLSPNQRIAIQLCELDGNSIREAANALGISKNLLKSRVSRARKCLKLILVEVVSDASCDSRRSVPKEVRNDKKSRDRAV
jgi:RNA polymerase sigma-70 factor (ECF subfamily)